MTAAGPPSAAARRLIAETIRSVGALDLLLMLRNDPDRWWTARELSDALRCPTGWAERELEHLREGNLLASAAAGDGEVAYAFRSAGPRLAEAVDALTAAYATNTREVVRLIFAARR